MMGLMLRLVAVGAEPLNVWRLAVDDEAGMQSFPGNLLQSNSCVILQLYCPVIFPPSSLSSALSNPVSVLFPNPVSVLFSNPVFVLFSNPVSVLFSLLCCPVIVSSGL